MHLFPDDIDEQVKLVSDMFPDCETRYLYEQLESTEKKDRVNLLVSKMLEQAYPKKNENSNKKGLPVEIQIFTVDEFLEKFPDPKKIFSSIDSDVSILYRQHAFAYLNNAHRRIKPAVVRQELEKHRFHLYPTLKRLSQLATEQGKVFEMTAVFFLL